MPKEDRSDWVAVQPEFDSNNKAPEIKKASSAYQYFQKAISAELKPLRLELAELSRTVRDRWNALSEEDREPYYQLARQDADRYAQASHQADIQALERQERLRQERESLMLGDDSIPVGRRMTRKGNKKGDDEEEEYENSSEAGDSDDDGTTGTPRKKKKQS